MRLPQFSRCNNHTFELLTARRRRPILTERARYGPRLVSWRVARITFGSICQEVVKMARLSRFLAPLMILAVLLSSAAVMLPAQQVFAAGPGEWDVNLDFSTSPNTGTAPMLFGTVIGGTADPYQTGAPDFDTIAPPPSPNSAYAFLSTPLESALYHDRRDVLGASTPETRSSGPSRSSSPPAQVPPRPR